MVKVWEFHHLQWCYSIGGRVSSCVYLSREKAEAASRSPQHFSKHSFTTRPGCIIGCTSYGVNGRLRLTSGVSMMPGLMALIRAPRSPTDRLGLHSDMVGSLGEWADRVLRHPAEDQAER